MINKKPTQRQLSNLARGREILFQNQLKRRGINPFSNPTLIRERHVIMQPVNQNINQYHSNTNINLSLFDKFIETKLFTFNKNNEKEILNLREIINYLLTKLNQQNNKLLENETRLNEVISYLDFKEKEYLEKFKNLQSRIDDLENKNINLKNKSDLQDENIDAKNGGE
ncbi:MAG TPA: hypothetical protein PLI99_01055 [archaeon]|nr:hypothetical protein [archaeon]